MPQPRTFDQLHQSINQIARRKRAMLTPYTGRASSAGLGNYPRTQFDIALMALRLYSDGYTPQNIRAGQRLQDIELTTAIDYDLINFPSPRPAMLQSIITNHRRRR
jgi:hypothetical protein